MSSLNNIEDYNMPVVIYITDATFGIVKALSNAELDKGIVDCHIRFVWYNQSKFEFLTHEQYEEKFSYAIEVGTVIFLPSGG